MNTETVYSLIDNYNFGTLKEKHEAEVELIEILRTNINMVVSVYIFFGFSTWNSFNPTSIGFAAYDEICFVEGEKEFYFPIKFIHITEIENTSDNNFLMFCNDTTHEPNLLQLPDYVPSKDIGFAYVTKPLSSMYTLI